MERPDGTFDYVLPEEVEESEELKPHCSNEQECDGGEDYDPADKFTWKQGNLTVVKLVYKGNVRSGYGISFMLITLYS